ncbi:alpha/beta fold hydrolase [Nocardiopsis sp. N85]|uniref:alpha/beta hydrolase n=1 Tax=Nocardiopsis sp. N85 TaxID=3029400 RepID=UPI00237F19BA|nr:alpha/beta fold hydrolase [Nocardiopsis sp. N85]MDE3721927.1 alpha/beta fold hydrolase [Nocardiopsis sp. N85]
MFDDPRVHVRRFTGRRAETEEALAALSQVSQAALRQFSLERTMAYGVDHGDVVELRARVVAGEDWRTAATDLARTCSEYADTAPGTPTRVAYLRRGSALLRMSQMMFLEDTDDRRAIFARAAELYDEAARLAGDRTRVVLESEDGPLAGWWLSAGPSPVGAVIVIGGIEGWAMDFDGMGTALAARGLDVLLLDGPGQGESRFTHRHYLTPTWIRAYERAIDHVADRSPASPIGIVGNSMGGGLAMAVAAHDPRVRACCSNGGLVHPRLVPPDIGTFFTKMVAFCGTDDPDSAIATWASVDPTADGPNSGYPLLVVHGGRDPMISDDLAALLLDGAPTDDKEMVVFSDGDHCVYNHRQDRDVLVADWMLQRLTTARGV